MLSTEELKTINKVRSESPALLDELRAVFKQDYAIARWLVKPKVPLGGKAPIELIMSPEPIISMLERIREGNMS